MTRMKRLQPSRIKPANQDYNSEAWTRLCAYVDDVATQGLEEFCPREALGKDLFSQIVVLPRTIAKLKSVKRISLYGSSLQRIPPEIGEMEALEYFDPYTSYDLHWLPYEITRCRRLIDSRISTRALYGNMKTRLPFPRLNDREPVYGADVISCSCCGGEIEHDRVDQRWITLRIGTDTVPLLVCLCSAACKNNLPATPAGYVDGPHKGGLGLPPIKTQNKAIEAMPYRETESPRRRSETKPSLFKVIKKIWER